MDRTVPAGGGRQLAVFDSGQGEVPILSIHGTGMGRTVYPPYLALATERGARVLSYDRPGLGRSTRRPGYRLADCAEDVQAIATALSLDRILVWGVSAGAPFALACAALLPDLVAAAATLGGRAPAGPGAEVPEILKDPDAARAEIEAQATADRARDAASWLETLAPGLPPADLRNLEGSGAGWFAADAQDALAPGGDGWFDEQMALEQDWGFDLASIRIPVLIGHGREDPWRDVSAAGELASRITGSELRLWDGIGHLSLLDRLDEVVDWLLARF